MLLQLIEELKPVMGKSAWQLGDKRLRIWLLEKAKDRVKKNQVKDDQ